MGVRCGNSSERRLHRIGLSGDDILQLHVFCRDNLEFRLAIRANGFWGVSLARLQLPAASGFADNGRSMSNTFATDRIELLAPAKNAEVGRQAILHGADAVYIGGPAFGARKQAGNAISDIAELVKFAHRYFARVYVTLNTILRDDELESAQSLAHELYDVGVDALIVQDMAMCELSLPPIALHASTQCDIRTPQRARFLADAGFSQLVLARELSLEQIAAIREAVPNPVVLEIFVHGALCVAFSGQCYISHARTGRSANRGACAQLCRLPYTLLDENGQLVAENKHLLSLKDNDQSKNLSALIAAGARSFKIEGRYKDVAHVKNVTAYYRQRLDGVLGDAPTLQKSSDGSCELSFAPDPKRTFHRGGTDYFAHGRQKDIGAFDAAGFVGPAVGAIKRISRRSFELQLTEDVVLSNGDGLAFMDQSQVVGMQADLVEPIGERLVRVRPNTMPPNLKRGALLHRNRDHTFERLLARPSAERRIAIWGHFEQVSEGFRFTLIDQRGARGSHLLVCDHELAKDAQRAERSLRDKLGRFGNTHYQLQELSIEWSQPAFIPTSRLNQLRREALDGLNKARKRAYTRPPRHEAREDLRYPAKRLSFRANVLNRAALSFYRRCGVDVVEPAFEHPAGFKGQAKRGEAIALMTTKHCLRHAFDRCPKERPEVGPARPMTLLHGDQALALTFDCRACEMLVRNKT
jgi:collagenase-like PrtC family protease